jgi:hypothetical protein
MLHLSCETADLHLAIWALDDWVLGQCWDIWLWLEVSNELRAILLTHWVDLSEFAVVEKDMIAAAVDTFNVHS